MFLGLFLTTLILHFLTSLPLKRTLILAESLTSDPYNRGFFKKRKSVVGQHTKYLTNGTLAKLWGDQSCTRTYVFNYLSEACLGPEQRGNCSMKTFAMYCNILSISSAFNLSASDLIGEDCRSPPLAPEEVRRRGAGDSQR